MKIFIALTLLLTLCPSVSACPLASPTPADEVHDSSEITLEPLLNSLPPSFELLGIAQIEIATSGMLDHSSVEVEWCRGGGTPLDSIRIPRPQNIAEKGAPEFSTVFAVTAPVPTTISLRASAWIDGKRHYSPVAKLYVRPYMPPEMILEELISLLETERIEEATQYMSARPTSRREFMARRGNKHLRFARFLKSGQLILATDSRREYEGSGELLFNGAAPPERLPFHLFRVTGAGGLGEYFSVEGLWFLKH